VSTKPVTGTTNASGITVLQLFPNAVAPDGLGTRCNLLDIRVAEPAPAPVPVVPNASTWQTLTDGPAIDWNVDAGQVAFLTLTTARLDRVLNNPTHIKAGTQYTLIVTQHVNGGQNITAFGDSIVQVESLTINPEANSVTVLQLFSDGTKLFTVKHGGAGTSPSPSPAPGPAPAPAPAGAPIVAAFAAGVNLSGMEWAAPGVRFGQSTYPDINYTVPRVADIAYLASQGVTLVRLPLTWELLQPLLASSPANATVRSGYTSSLQATFNAGDLWEPQAQYVDKILDACLASGIKCVLDIHNYARYRDFKYQLDGSVIGWTRVADKLVPPYTTDNTQIANKIFAKVAPTLTKADFNALWTKMATRWKTHAGLGGYGLMNEPNNMPAVGKNFGINDYPNPTDPTNDYAQDYTIWNDYAQSAVTAIRVVDGTTPIYVSGNVWSSPVGWAAQNPGYPLTGGNLIYEFHLYLDATNGGFRFDWDAEVAKGFSAGESGVISSATGTNRIAQMTAWSAAHGNAILACGEFGIPVVRLADGTIDTRWLVAAKATLDTLKAANIKVFTWMGGNHWPIHGYPINHVPKWYQGTTVEPIAGAYLQNQLLANQATVFDEGRQYSTGAPIPITVQARGNRTAAINLTVASDNGGAFSKTALVLAAGVNSEDSFTFTPPANTVCTLTYTRTGGGQVPPPRVIYSLADPAGYAPTSLPIAAKAIMAKYGAACWLAKDGFKDYLTPTAVACAAGDYLRAITDSGSGSTIENPMEAINWLNQDAGSIRSTQVPALFNNDPDGVAAADFTVYGRRGLMSKHLLPVVAASPSNDNYPYPAARMPFDLTDPHFMVAAFKVTSAGTTGTLMAAQEITAHTHSAIKLNAGKTELNQGDIANVDNIITDAATVALNTATTASMASSNGAQRLRVNGVQVGTSAANFSASPFGAASIGMGYWDYYPQDAIQGYEHAWIMGKGSITDAELTVLENYAKSFSQAPVVPLSGAPLLLQTQFDAGNGGIWLSNAGLTEFCQLGTGSTPPADWTELIGRWKNHGMKLTLGVFSGAVKALHPKLVPDAAGVDSLNQKPGRGDFRPWKQPLAAATVPASRQTIYRMGRDVKSDSQYWLSWPTRVHVVRGYDGADTTERTYFTGSGTPKWIDNTFALAGGGPYPVATRELGVPAPTGALVAASNNDGASTNTESRYYTYTYVNAKGDESAPGPVSRSWCARPTTRSPCQRIAAPPGGYNVDRIRVYAPSAASQGETEFFFLRELAWAPPAPRRPALAPAMCWRPTAGSCRRRT
jgi:endoglucanase